MLLHTPIYLLFLFVVVLAYWALPSASWRKVLLILSSFFFYALFDWRFALLLFILSISTYFLGKAISTSRYSKEFTWLSVILSLGVLGVFKYGNFFLDSIETSLKFFGLEFNSPGLFFLLPVGISFYTFQAISYTTQIYQRKIEPATSFTDVSLYLVFFPKLIAGPLVRPTTFLKSLKEAPQPLNWRKLQPILNLLLLGLVKKIVIADSLASLGDTAFRAASLPGVESNFMTPLFLSGFYLYAFQIYCDFSGYTDIARASAKLLGFELPENFEQPYLSSSITSFWNRWHMTLTQWFREYLYFPVTRKLLLKTNRRYPRLVQVCANVLTMTLIGLWHGSSWTYLVWGLWHGILISIESFYKFKPSYWWQRVMMGVITFHLVGVGWILFRAESFEATWRFIVGLVDVNGMIWLPHYLPSILLTGSLVLGIDVLKSGRLYVNLNLRKIGQPILVVAALVVISILVLLGFAHGSDTRPFIYGQF